MTKKEQEKLHKRFKFCGQKSLEWRRECELMLPKIAEEKIWERKGFNSIYEYAAKLAGMGKSAVDTTLWVMRKIENMPELKQVVAEKGIGRVRPVANVATQETEKFWAEKARQMSCNTVRVFVREKKRHEKAEDFCDVAKTQSGEVEILMKLKPELAEKLMNLKAGATWDELIESLLKNKEEEVKRKKLKKPKPVKATSRHIPAEIKQYVLEKHHKCCGFPGCGKPYKILHHTQRLALEKTHDPDKIVPLCKEHEQICHHNLVENEEESPETWQIRDHPDHCDPKFWIDQMVDLYRPT